MRDIALIALLTTVTASTLAQQPQMPRADAARGKVLYEANKCADCHRLGESGSRVGPDLSGVGDARTFEQLYRAIVAPDDEVLGEHRGIRVVLKDGTTVAGRILNQDAFSIQLLTSTEQLKSYARADLREHSILTKGLMPSYEGKLSSQDVGDIVRYVSSWQPTEAAAASVAKGTTYERILSADREPHTG